MRFFLLSVIYGIIVVALQTTWLVAVPFTMVRIDFIFMSVVTIALTEEWRRAIPVVIFLGAIVDATSIAPFGLSIFSYLVLYGFMRVLIAKISVQGLGRFVWVAIVSLLDKTICTVLMVVWTGNTMLMRTYLPRAIPQAVCDALLGFLFIPLLTWYGSLTWEKLTRPSGLVMK